MYKLFLTFLHHRSILHIQTSDQDPRRLYALWMQYNSVVDISPKYLFFKVIKYLSPEWYFGRLHLISLWCTLCYMECKFSEHSNSWNSPHVMCTNFLHESQNKWSKMHYQYYLIPKEKTDCTVNVGLKMKLIMGMDSVSPVCCNIFRIHILPCCGSCTFVFCYVMQLRVWNTTVCLTVRCWHSALQTWRNKCRNKGFWRVLRHIFWTYIITKVIMI